MVSEEKFMLEFLQWIIGWIQVIPWLVMGASLIAAELFEIPLSRQDIVLKSKLYV